jgi:FeS assembly SUF system protein
MNLRNLFRDSKSKAKTQDSPASPPDSQAARPSPSVPTQSVEVTQDQIIDVLRMVYDPEIPVNIYEIGLVYGIEIKPHGNVVIQMTLTSPGCPVAGSLPLEVEDRVLAIPGVTSVYVDLVWDPPWTPDRMSDAAKLQLGML